MIIDRPDYIEKIHEFKDTKIIKILTGLRRSGKSTLLKLIQKKLINAGIVRGFIKVPKTGDLILNTFG